MRTALICVALSLNFAEPSRAADEHQIRRDCTWDALRYCKAEILTTDRSLIVACMVDHKDRLQAKCSRHFYRGEK